jgi:hypothetical protein
MSKNLRIDLEIGLDKARAALKQLQQEANQISKARGGGGSGGGSSSGGLFGGLGLSAAGAAAGAAAAAIAAVGAELKALSSRAVELSQSASSATSQLGQLRSAVERSNISKDVAATSPAVVSIAKAAADFQKEFSDALAAAGSTPQERQKALAEKLSAGLGGEDKETWQRMKEARSDLEVDVSHQRQALDVAQFRQNRDYALQLQQFNIQASRQKADLDKESARTQFDYTVARTKFEEDQAGKMAQKSYDLSRQFAAQNFAIQKGRSVQDYQIARGDRSVDFGVNRARSSEEFGINRARNTEDFNINRARQGQDYRENLQKSILSGNVNGLDLMFAARDYRKQQARELEDFGRQQTREQGDFGRSQRNATQDYNLANSRDSRNFSLGQQRAGEDYTQQARQAAAGRELEIENHLYERKYASLELEVQHARALKDLNIAYERMTQDISIGAAKLSNQGADIAQDQAIANRDFAIETGRKLRNSDYGYQDFAGAMRKKDPLAAAGQGAQDSTFAQALGANAKATGQADLFKQVNDAVQSTGIGTKIGDVFKALITDVLTQTLDGLNLSKNPNALSLNPLDWFRKTPAPPNKPDMSNEFDRSYQNELNGKAPANSGTSKPQVIIQTGNNTFNLLDPGLTVSIQKYIDDQDKKRNDDIMDMIKRYYGG